MSAPLVVNTADGSCWVRRALTREGHGLYALAGSVAGVPDGVLMSLSELAVHGITGSADVLPVPVGPGPVVRPLALHEAQIDALAAAGDRVVNDAVHQDLCACDAWPEKCVSTGNYFMGAWDVSGLETALPAVLGLWERMRGGELERLRSQVDALQAERHSTNEALDDAVKALRLRNTQRGDVAQLIERERQCNEECVDIDDLEAALALGSDEPAPKCRCDEPDADPYSCEADDCTGHFSELNPFGGGSGPVEGHDAKVSRTCGKCDYRTSVWHVADGSAEAELHDHVTRVHGDAEERLLGGDELKRAVRGHLFGGAS